MNYDIIGWCSICSAATLPRPSCGSGLAATLPRLCRPGPALAEPLGPDFSASAIDIIRGRPRP